MSSMMFNDQYLVAGTSLPDQNIEDLQNLIIEKTIGVWKRETLDTAVLKRAGMPCSFLLVRCDGVTTLQSCRRGGTASRR